MTLEIKRYGISISTRPPLPNVEYYADSKDVPVFATFDQLKRELKGRCVTMILGYGTKMGYKSVSDLREKVDTYVRGETLLYFGDEVDYKNPTVGLAFLFAAARSGADVYMVQISGAKSYPVPTFVHGVYWHDSWKEGPFKWGGVEETDAGTVIHSNTAVWNELFLRGIEFRAYVLGGGPTALQEVQLIKRLGIPLAEIKIEPARE